MSRSINKEVLNRAIEARAQGYIKTGHIAGCSVRVYQSGDTVCSREFGYSDPNSGEPVRPDSVFRLASMTKPVVAAAVLICMQRGLLSPLDRLSDYFPGFAELRVGSMGASGKEHSAGRAERETAGEAGGREILRRPAREVTLLDLLSHTAGFGTDENAAELDRRTQLLRGTQQTLGSTVRFYEDELVLSFDPGSRRSYSPIAAFDALAAVVELVSGMSIDSFVRDNILVPLGMNDTSFVLSPSLRSRLVCMHNLVNGIPEAHRMDSIFSDFPATYHSGGAGLVSTADDYLRFALMLLEGTKQDTPVLTHSSVELMRTPVSVAGDGQELPEEMFGFGVRVIIRDGILPRGAFGWSGAYGTHFWVDPDNDLVAVLMKNSLYDGGAGCGTAVAFEQDVMSALCR